MLPKRDPVRKGTKNRNRRRKNNKSSKSRRRVAFEKRNKDVSSFLPTENEISVEELDFKNDSEVFSANACQHDTYVIESEEVIQEVQYPSSRVICNFEFVVQQIRQLEEHSYKCEFGGKFILKNVSHKGLIYTYMYICNKMLCTETFKVTTDKERGSLNHLAVLGAISSGSGFSQEQEKFAIMNMTYMNKTTFARCEKVAGNITNSFADEVMLSAINHEKLLSETRGDVDSDGYYNICAIVDGGWCKRSYGHGYNASSGVAVIIGSETQKILFLSVKNKVCLICSAIANGRMASRDHVCSRNWTGPSTAMESQIVVEGLNFLQEVHKIRCIKIIGDGDANTMKKVKENVSYGGNVLKVECANHAVRRYFRALDRLQKNTSRFSGAVGLKARQILCNRLPRLVIGAREAIKSNAVSILSICNEENTKQLASELMNGPYHVFGKHEACGAFCKRKTSDPDTCVVSAIVESGMMTAISDEVRRVLLSNCNTLIFNVTNNSAECFMSLLCKTTGGKRVDFSKARSFERRANIAALSFQTPASKWHSKAYRRLTGGSPGTPSHKYISQRVKKHIQSLNRRKLFSSRVKRKMYIRAGGDKNYGDIPSVPDLPPDVVSLKIMSHMESIQVSSRSQIEVQTRRQALCDIWRIERARRIPSSVFKDVVNRRPWTPSKNLVKKIIYGGNVSTVGMKYGVANEATALKEYEMCSGRNVVRCGLFIDPLNPFLCSSPDGLVDNNGLVEIKCPFSARDACKIGDVCATSNIGIKKHADGALYLPSSHRYYFQIQGQLAITNRKWCDLFVWCKSDSEIIRIERNETFWHNIVPKLKIFYEKCILPEIVDPRAPRKLKLREPDYIVKAMEEREKQKKTCKKNNQKQRSTSENARKENIFTNNTISKINQIKRPFQLTDISIQPRPKRTRKPVMKLDL